MPTRDELLDRTADAAVWYEISYASDEYTFPTEALIHRASIDSHHIHLHLTDGRILSIPLSWIPTVHNASPEDRNGFQISRDRKVVVWDPDRCSINDELHVDDYLLARRS